MSRQYDNYIHSLLEPNSVLIKGNRKQHKPWPEYVDKRSEQSKRLDAVTLAELEEIEERHLLRNGIN